VELAVNSTGTLLCTVSADKAVKVKKIIVMDAFFISKFYIK